MISNILLRGIILCACTQLCNLLDKSGLKTNCDSEKSIGAYWKVVAVQTPGVSYGNIALIRLSLSDTGIFVFLALLI